MKHSDFYKMVRELKLQEASELRAALEAHGGSYEFPEDEQPIVAAYPSKHAEEIEDVYIHKAFIDEFDYLQFDISTKYGYEGQIFMGEIAPGYIDYIIDNIPETPEVSDVTGK